MLKNIITYYLTIILLISFSQLGCKKKTTDDKINDYTDSIKLSPNNIHYYEERAKLYYFSKQGINALTDVKKAIELGSNTYESYFIAGCIYSHDSSYVKAVEYLTKGLELTTDSSATHSQHFFRAMAYFKLGNYESAIIDLEKINHQNEYSGILSECYLFVRRIDKAIEELIKNSAKEECDSNRFVDVIYNDIAILFTVNKDYPNALMHIEKAINHKNGFLYHQFYRGVIYYKLKEYQKSIDDLENVSLLDTNKKHLAEYYLSMLYAEKKDNKKALTHLEKAFQEGFMFFDIIESNPAYKDIVKHNYYNKIRQQHLSKINIKDKSQMIENILLQGKILTLEDDEIAKSRIDAIFASPHKLDEFIRLKKLLREEKISFQ